MGSRKLVIASIGIVATGVALALLAGGTTSRAAFRQIGLFIPCVFEEGLVCQPAGR